MKDRFDNDPENKRNFIRNMGVGRFIGMTVSRLCIMIVFALLFAWLVMLLWNWLLPATFGVKTINFLQAFGYLILSKLLLTGFHHSGHERGGHPMHRRDNRGWAGDDEEFPARDHTAWKQYRQYWKERGKEDFHAYLKKLNESDRENDKIDG